MRSLCFFYLAFDASVLEWILMLDIYGLIRQEAEGESGFYRHFYLCVHLGDFSIEANIFLLSLVLSMRPASAF